MPSPLRISKTDATIESISGLAVTRCCVKYLDAHVMQASKSQSLQ
jgi:hypothetical protein